MGDNFHQSVMGGTAANHVALGTGDFMSWTTFAGLTQPPSNIANPNPTSSTSDKYVADKVFTECADTTQPGIQAIVSYLSSLPYHPAPNCETGIFYMINNLSPGFLPTARSIRLPSQRETRYRLHRCAQSETHSTTMAFRGLTMAAVTTRLCA
jgi:phospholipase C